MEIVTEDQGGVAILRPKGKIEMMYAPELREAIQAKTAAGFNKIVIDMRSVTFLDSSGYGVLIEAAHALTEKGGSFRLLGAQNRMKLLLNQNVIFCESEAEALA
ncbi:MAG: STAS domain-containing protein [Spirochaetia bacterium]|nr:STAS domain-containing protein [Spirochaetia bacterium]